jgi:uncharacterized SAM-binding protein YcdF (DUF218 family)
MGGLFVDTARCGGSSTPDGGPPSKVILPRPRKRLDGHAMATPTPIIFSRAIVLLGCTLRWRDNGRELDGAVARRVHAAAEAARNYPAAVVVASGGRAWHGVLEADAMREALIGRGIARARVLPERCSYSTRDNARFTAVLLRRIGIHRATIVTCDWHQARAQALFRAEGLEVDALPVASPPARWPLRVWRWGRERVAARLHGVTAG